MIPSNITLFIVSGIQAIALLYVAYRGVLALNAMGRHTPHSVRYAYLALVAGSVSGLASSFVARDIFECVFAVGIALFMAGNRRGVAA